MVIRSVKCKIEKLLSDNSLLFVLKDLIKLQYRPISIGNYEDKKKCFIRLHYLKMHLDYTYLKIYHNEIKKNLHNEKLLKYFESILAAQGFNIRVEQPQQNKKN